MTASQRVSIHDLLADLEGRHDLSCVALSSDDLHDYVPHAEEQEALSGNEVAKRRAEFISGRAAANRAMTQLGIQSPRPVLRGPIGEPVWPEGIVGSITHSYPWTIAIVARSRDFLALGIDLESVSRLREQDISEDICTLAEREWTFTQIDASVALGKIFSGKEALYKTLSPRCGRRFEFKDVELSWIPDRKCFSAELLIDLGRQCMRGHRTDVYTRAAGDWVFAYIIEVAR